MGRLVVVEGAVLRCPAGSESSGLTVTTSFTQPVDGKPVATVNDKEPGVNFKRFGDCAIKGKGKRCDPEILGLWQPGESSILLPSLFPILSDDSTLRCNVGSDIVVEHPGQNFFVVDSPEGGADVPGQDVWHLPDWLRDLDAAQLTIMVIGSLGDALGQLGKYREELRRLALKQKRIAKKISQRGGQGPRKKREQRKRKGMRKSGRRLAEGNMRKAGRPGTTKLLKRGKWAEPVIGGGQAINDVIHGRVGDGAVRLGESGGAYLGTGACVVGLELISGGTVGLLGGGLCSATAGTLGGRVGGAVTKVVVKQGSSFFKNQLDGLRSLATHGR